MDEDELEALRQKRLAEIQAMSQGQDPQMLGAQHEAQVQQQAQAEALKEQALRKILTTEAKARLANLRMVHPQQAAVLESQLLGLAQSGQIRSVIDEHTLRQLISRLKPPRREINITRR